MKWKEALKSRPLIQTVSTLVHNANLAGFFTGRIYTGGFKHLCVPGLNCYSCPGALGACPIGALQAVAGSRKFSVSYYVVGILLLFGTLFGRLICGFLCPFGFLQDLLYRIPTRKLRLPRRVDRPLRYLKYLLLFGVVVLLPAVLTNAYGQAAPYFCKWICPAGTLEGGIPLLVKNESLRAAAGWLFGWKGLLLVITLLSSVFIYRPFCKYLCPLGAAYSLFNRFSFYRMAVDRSRCNGCRLCERSCKMQVPVLRDINSPECIRCGECKRVCPQSAIHAGFDTGAIDAVARRRSDRAD